ncbi:MAG TPA: hypothetical protein GXZ56_07870 [Bacteroidales bacterium]|nr:hypothetical protein [Bacteroidales bacterium]
MNNSEFFSFSEQAVDGSKIFAMSDSKCKACFDFAERSKYLSHENELQPKLKANNKHKDKS